MTSGKETNLNFGLEVQDLLHSPIQKVKGGGRRGSRGEEPSSFLLNRGFYSKSKPFYEALHRRRTEEPQTYFGSVGGSNTSKGEGGFLPSRPKTPSGERRSEVREIGGATRPVSRNVTLKLIWAQV